MALRRPSLSAREWGILALLALSVLINYIDRANLSVGATNIQAEFGLDDYRLGILLSAFSWTYAAMQLFGVSGWLVDRLPVSWVYAGGFLLWSGATAWTGIAGGFASIFALRLMLGIGESVSYPSYSRILSNHFPEHRRGFANGIIDAGSKLGPAVGTLVGGLFMARYGWRAFFLGLGALSLLWLVPWVKWMPRGEHYTVKRTPAGAPTSLDILRHPCAWGSFAGLFCSNYFWYFLIAWLPAYLEQERHFAKPKMAVFGSLAFLAIALTSLFAGWLSDRWIASGASPTLVRKTFAGAGLGCATIIVTVAVVQNETLAMILLMIACISYGAYSPNLWAITQTLAGPLASGKWTGLQNGVGNLAGIAAPWFTGWVVERTGHFYLAFLVAGLVALAGAFAFVFGIGPIVPRFPEHEAS